MAKKIKPQEDSLFDLGECAKCGGLTTNDNRDKEHKEYHQSCCPKCN